MSWLQKLYETYERCAGNEPDGAGLLEPVSHMTLRAHIEIVIDGAGSFRRARVLNKESIVLPATEESANRSSNCAPHALADTIQYCAGDYSDFGGKKPYFEDYYDQLASWCASDSAHPKAKAVLEYVRKRSVVADLVVARVVHTRSGELLGKWEDPKTKPELFKELSDGQQRKALIRWVVEADDPRTETWLDVSLQESWRNFYAGRSVARGICLASGKRDGALAKIHPRYLRYAGDSAKLISSNDADGFTFRGRFMSADEALAVGFEVSQKAHNALRWLIERQAYRNSGQVIVTWSVGGKPVPDLFADSHQLFSAVAPGDLAATSADTDQAFAARLNKAIAGYGAGLDPLDDVVVMALDSAVPGRLAVTFYRELLGSEFLERIRAWHARCAWPQNFGKARKFVGAPAPRDVAEAAYGPKLDDKLKRATIERILPSIIDRRAIPRDLVEATRRRASNRSGSKPWEWEKCLGVACALYRAHHPERNYLMTLEPNRRSRDYLYGRLLAVAEHLEGRALWIADETRDTTSARLMQRFAERPYSTWKTIELALVPYKSRLRAKRTGFLIQTERLIDEVIDCFEPDQFCQDDPLSGEFLLGYHCQRRVLRGKSEIPGDDHDGGNDSEQLEEATQ